LTRTDEPKAWLVGLLRREFWPEFFGKTAWCLVLAPQFKHGFNYAP
jgi:hypothetical protein